MTRLEDFSPSLFLCPHFLSSLRAAAGFYREVKLEYRTLKEKMKEFNKKEAKFYGNMFAKLAKSGSPESNVSLLCLCFTKNLVYASKLDLWFVWCFWIGFFYWSCILAFAESSS